MGNEEVEPVEIRAVSERRFNAHVVWARGPGGLPPIKEVAWLEIEPARVFGTIFLDLTDKDLHSAVMAPDLAGRYRGVEILQDHADIREAVERTAESMVRVHNDYDNERKQGDEKASWTSSRRWRRRTSCTSALSTFVTVRVLSRRSG